MEKITILQQTETIFKKNWKFCIGTGRLGLALQKEYIEHLKEVQEKINFDYIRGHGLLHDDVGIYREIELEDGSTEAFYNFTYIDRIFDMYLDMGIRPFIEFGFMPKLLASGDQTVFAWKGNVTPPQDYDKWYDLIQAVVSHFIERYGLEEVLKWPFEVWNEPNLTNFWKDADKEEYFKLYKVTSIAVKDVHPDLQVGGPAICGGADEWITDFLNFCENESAPVDFVSRHAYTTAKPHKVTPEYYYQELFENDYMLKELKTVRELINASPFPDLPFHITEYNTSYSPINPIHDTTLNAAYLARILSEAGDYVDSFSYWTFSDVFEEADVPKSQFHGGFGLIGLNGIYKPTFHLFSFFNQLGVEQLHRDDNILVTRREDGSLAIAVWNMVLEKGDGFEKHFELDLPIQNNKDVFIKRQTIDENNGNPWKVWKQMGRPRFPKKDQIETLKEVAKPRIRTERTSTKNGRVKLTFTLTKNEVCLIEVNPINDETKSYIGLDDSQIPSYSKEWC
ncbi:GH39 family glycosyl hydrolase [Evansella tamaricis]|uniref:Xylan 1,4-beta-xylosidase n=1 Tax=Evansella tamaricis TaxID=2069301 RepID=A0ABS6JHG8_9BACI|nr:xylan 1,4-beta-xylosidase [Evansella tamaricis]MBU9712968.1 xylan 1,4-beta-xylosidase [Evansella tamaricis]